MKTFLPNREKFSQGFFTPKNPDKYKGQLPIRYLSSWEFKVMQMLDNHPNILYWSSESIAIPYMNPYTKKPSKYYPDFIVVYVDKYGKEKREMIEVKPASETFLESAKSKKQKLAIGLNSVKWAAAKEFSKRNGMTFRVITEHNIFAGKR